MKYLVIIKYSVEANSSGEAKRAIAGVVAEYLSVQEAPSVSFKPGDIFGRVILMITGQHTTACGECGTRKRQMNEWGWLGCWQKRKLIIRWLIEEARKRGHEIGDEDVLALFKAAAKEIGGKFE